MAFEKLHCMKTKTRGRSPHMAHKLDLSKRYDKSRMGIFLRNNAEMDFHFCYVSIIV